MAKKGRKPRDPNHDRHHLRARVRGGGHYNNIVVLPRDFHAGLHRLFGVMMPDEIAQFVTTVLVPNTSWTHRDLHNLRERIMHERLAS